MQPNHAVLKKTYNFLGLTINIAKLNHIVNLTITGGLNQDLTGNTFYDVELDDVFKPIFEINDTFGSNLTKMGMIRITSNGTLRLYPWTPLILGDGVRYNTSYISEK